MEMHLPVPTAVYRFFDKEDALLYVGITNSPAHRWRQHAAAKSWWTTVHRATLEWHASTEDATSAEMAAIRTEKPVHNIAAGALAAINRLAILEHAAFEAHAARYMVAGGAACSALVQHHRSSVVL